MSSIGMEIDEGGTVSQFLNVQHETYSVLSFSLRTDSDATIDVEGVACDVFDGRVQGKEPAHAGDFFRLAQPFEGDNRRDLFKVRVVQFGDHVSGDVTRTDAVNKNIP